MAKQRRYRVLEPAYWREAYAPDAPPHPFGINYPGLDGAVRRAEAGDVVDDLPSQTDVEALVSQGILEEAK